MAYVVRLLLVTVKHVAVGNELCGFYCHVVGGTALMAVLGRGLFQPVQAKVFDGTAVLAGSFDPLATAGVSFGEFSGYTPNSVEFWRNRSLV